jgi:hypothetical protein
MEILKIFRVIIYSILIFFISFTACSDKSKNLFDPTFDNRIQFSLSERNYLMEDIIKRQSQIFVDSGKYLLRFTTDEIRKDTILETFTADFFQMSMDTTFQIFFSDTIKADMVIRRDSVGIQEAEIAKGFMDFRFINYTNKNAFFRLIFPTFTKQFGNTIDTLSVGGSILPNQTVVYRVDLKNYSYRISPNQPGYPAPGFWVKNIIAIQNGFIGDSIGVFSKVEDLELNRMEGKFKPFNIGLKEQTLENALSKDISEFIQNVEFDSVLVTLKGFSSVNFPVKLKNFSVKGIFKDGKPPVILQFGNRTSIDTVVPKNGSVVLNFDNTNSTIGNFLSKAPDSIRIFSEMIINPFYETGEVVSNDSISFSTVINAWSRFTINDAEWTDTLEVDISSDSRDKLKKGKNSIITIYSENKIAFESFLTGLFVDSLFQPLFYLTKDLVRQNDSTLLMYGAFTDVTGNVIAPRYQTVTIPLNPSELEKLSRAYHLIQKFTLSTTDRRLAEVKAKDYVKIRITGQAIISLIGDDF